MNIPKAEEKTLNFWKEERVYQKLREKLKNKERLYFLDGPPYASGHIHLGTALNKILKDSFLRFFRMQGYNVWDKPGYDTHGVPIEIKVEKKLGFKTKRDIEKFGVENFIKECKKFATQFIDVMSEEFGNLGVWMDWKDPYLTLTNEYIEGAWFTFKKAFENGFLYMDVYPVHVCPRCETTVSYNEIEYKEVEDPSIYVKFPLKEKEFLVVWTTTPWTLPSNTGVMIHPHAEYARVKVNDEVWIMAKNLVEGLMEEFGIDKFEIIDVKVGREFVGKRYENPIAGLFPFTKNLRNAYRIVESERYVSLEEGTGLVHCAPGHGKEDFEVGKKFGLPVINPLKMNGAFDERSGKFAGMFAKEADKLIIDELRKRMMLVKEGKIRHEYPLCWRCDSPLLLQTLSQWFFGVTRIRKKLLEENEKVNWFPDWAKNRFKNWLESLGDWPISRQRYWGIPLPIWICEKCDKVRVIGSADELPKTPSDLHKPYIDEVTLTCECGGEMKRIKDVLDVWFDSGVAPWASLGYPRIKKTFEELWPVYFVLEGPDQIRGWWNSLLLTSVMTFGRRPFERVLYHGFVLDAHGVKMSKSRGNIVGPHEVIGKYGRDVLRLYFMSKEVWNDYFFRWEDVHEIARKLMIVRNVFNFVNTYVVEKGEREELEAEDRWIISRLNSLIKNCTAHFNSFEVHKVASEILDFVINDLSHFYIKLVRDRVWINYDGKDKRAAFYTLLKVCDGLLRLLSPLTPFLTEDIYQRMKEKFEGKELSVHLLDWPRCEESEIDEELERKMDVVKKLVEGCLMARNRAKIKLRWPLPELIILPKDDEIVECVKDLEKILLKLCNVKEVRIGGEADDKFEKVETDLALLLLNKEMDEKLREECIVNEVVRNIQELRKKEKLNVWERVDVFFVVDENLKNMLSRNSDEILMRINGSEIHFDRLEGAGGEFEVFGKKIKFSFKRLKS